MQIKGASEAFTPKVFSNVSNNQLEVEFKQNYFDKVNFTITKVNVSRTDVSEIDTYIKIATNNLKSTGFRYLNCKVDKKVEFEESFKLFITCNEPIAQKGKLYGVEVYFKAVAKHSSVNLLVFGNCAYKGQIDECESEYRVVLSKN